jgi:hypothetical protein
MRGEGAQQLEFDVRELDRLAANLDVARGEVDSRSVGLIASSSRPVVGRRAAKQRLTRLRNSRIEKVSVM